MKLPLSLVLCLPLTALAVEPSPGAPAFFEKQIRPLLAKHCTECHGEKKQKAELRLDLRAPALKGGENGAVILPGDGGKSPLLQRVLSTDKEEQMPPKGERLDKEEVAALKAWIEAGAPWPESAADRAAAVDSRLQHWSLQPVKVAASGGASIDTFIAEKLKEAGLAMSPEADRRTLIRRATFDVTGLPPTPEEVEAFVADPDPKAYERLVDRLLASPRFGECWARHWLDVVRFAESDGFEMNGARANAWPYRDYVIRAFNDDKPYDQFVREQLAGDAFGEDAATGFLVGGATDRVKSQDPVLTANQRADELHDMVSTTAATFLGLTVNCARCHDHKFDPIPTKDYYAMIAMLQGVQHGERPMRTPDDEAKSKQAGELRAEVLRLDARLSEFHPKARLGHILLIDDTAPPSAPGKAGITQLEQPKNGVPVAYSSGELRGQAGDLGDVTRLPNLGASYRYWETAPEKAENLFTWDPRLSGRHRVWLSWGVWTTHAKDARYVLDRDGNLATTNDQTEIAQIDQSRFADGTPAVPGEKRWSEFRLAGEFDLTPQSIVVLRSGSLGGPHTADLVAFEEVTPAAAPPRQLALRAPVTQAANEDRFAPTMAKFVRFTITEANSAEPCLDELELFSAQPGGPNLASAALGTKTTASGVYDSGKNPKHQLAHINDGRYGNSYSWISNEKGAGWVQLELPRPQEIARVVWSRDRSNSNGGKPYEDRLAIGYRMEVSLDGHTWKAVAASSDRLPTGYRQRVAEIPTLSEVPAAQVDEVASLARKRSALLRELASQTKLPMVYAGKFEEPGPTHRNHRGDPMQPREEVAPGALSLIGPGLTLPATTRDQERRMALANWIVQPDHPLTARVIVNRLWHYHFGTGLVDTPSDFGINGSQPTHPELLDWLAHELVANRWSLKHLHRLILLSATYRQSSATNEAGAKVDSGARLLWRFPPRRLEAETLRDAMLAVTGKLDLTMGGPGFDLFEPNTNYVKVYVTKAEYGPAEFRRMVYQSKPRTMLDDFFGAFDCPDAGQPAPKRTSSTTPLQALNLLNSSFALQQAGFLATRLTQEAGTDPTAQVKRAFALMFGRGPSSEELADSTQLIAQYGLPIFCRALFNANEFIRLN